MADMDKRKIFSRNQAPLDQSYDATADSSGSVTPSESSGSVTPIATTMVQVKNKLNSLPPRSLSQKILESMVLLSALANADKDGDIPSPEKFKNTLSNLRIFGSVQEYIDVAPAKAKSAAKAAKNAAANAAAHKAQAQAGPKARFKREQAANQAAAAAEAAAAAAAAANDAAKANPSDETKAAAAKADAVLNAANDAAIDADAAAAGQLVFSQKDFLNNIQAKAPPRPNEMRDFAPFGEPTGKSAANFSRVSRTQATSKASTASARASDAAAAPPDAGAASTASARASTAPAGAAAQPQASTRAPAGADAAAQKKIAAENLKKFKDVKLAILKSNETGEDEEDKVTRQLNKIIDEAAKLHNEAGFEKIQKEVNDTIVKLCKTVGIQNSEFRNKFIRETYMHYKLTRQPEVDKYNILKEAERRKLKAALLQNPSDGDNDDDE